MRQLTQIKASFRDPSGFIFKKDGVVYRQINKAYQKEYDLLISSGLFEKLTKEGLLINHEEVSGYRDNPEAYKIIKPEQIPFISYPYEWSFSQLKDAATATLKIQEIALEHGMSLKDSSAYNIQFYKGKPVFIDTLSFEIYKEGTPWVGYRQFCQHFLAPLALMAHKDLRFGLLSQIHIDGIPLDFAANILPTKTKFSMGLGTHLHLHSRSQTKKAETNIKEAKRSLSLGRQLAILDNLKSTVKSLKLPKQKTVWQDYYDNTNYTSKATKEKQEIISDWIKKIKPKTLWDAGANDGTFSQLASTQKIFTVATDFDHLAVENAYLKTKERKDIFLLPLIIDMTTPSPAIGWENLERDSFLKRSSFDLTLCLALIHHLAIANNLPLAFIAELLSKHTEKLIIEFVPKEDSNTQKLLASREDIFPNYNEKSFEEEFSAYFKILDKRKISQSHRTLYLMELR